MRSERSVISAAAPEGVDCEGCGGRGRPGYVPVAVEWCGVFLSAWQRCPKRCGARTQAQARLRAQARACSPRLRQWQVPAAAPAVTDLTPRQDRTQEQDQAAAVAPRTSAKPQARRAPAARKRAATAAPAAQRGPELVAAVLLDVDGSAVVADVPGVGLPGAKTLDALFAWLASGPALGVAPVHKDGRRHNGTVILSDALCKALKLPAKLPEQSKRAALVERLRQAADTAGCELGQVGPRIAVKPRKAEGVRRAPSVTVVVSPWLGQGQGPEQAVNYWLDRLGDGDARTLARRLRSVAADLGVPLTGTARVTARTLLEAVRPREQWGPNRDGTRIPRDGALPDGDTCVPPAAGRWHPLTRAALEAGEPVCREDDFARWTRPLTEQEAALPLAVEVDVCTAHLAVTGSLALPVSPLQHTTRPMWDKRTAGLWWCDFTGLRLAAAGLTLQQCEQAAALLPHPATVDGQAPNGPGWYATPTVAYMVEAYGFDPATITQAYTAAHSAVVLKEWTARLRDAYKFRLAVLGIGEAMDPAAFTVAYAAREEAARGSVESADALALVDFYKDVYRANTGSWSENPRGDQAEEMERWLRDVVASWHYRPEYRFTILAASRTAMHRRLVKTFALTGRAPFAVHVDGVVYASVSGDPAELVALDAAGKQVPGAVRLGAAPGSCKHDATVPMDAVRAALESGEPLQGAHGLMPRYDTTGQLIEQEEEANRG